MARQGIIATQRMDGAAAVRAADAFKPAYAEAFAEPPYGETEDDVAAAFRRFPVQARNDTFARSWPVLRTASGSAWRKATGSGATRLLDLGQEPSSNARPGVGRSADRTRGSSAS
ncbi:hypothetical protein [Streptomyces sp. Tue6028]|uniref:hypothetical protein n=1 Tax=Streptomyces sp. Tue6028 TaxID=2036037 RepID=UPI003EB78F41